MRILLILLEEKLCFSDGWFIYSFISFQNVVVVDLTRKLLLHAFV
jgi:hypothetical protein